LERGADGGVGGGWGGFARVVVQSKGFELDDADVGEVDPAVVIVFHEAALAVAQDHEAVAPVPEHASVPTALAEYASAGVYSTPRQCPEVQCPQCVFLLRGCEEGAADDEMVVYYAAVGKSKAGG